MLVLIVAFAVFAADQLSKHWVAATFMPGESRVLIPHVVYWTYVQNTRGAFGLFGDQAWLLIILAVAVLAIFWFSFRDIAAQSWLVRVALGGIVGGAAGNIADRLQHRYVVDFIDLRWWPVFNVADSCITIGVCLLIIATLARDRAVARSQS
ncbi:MAG TPA: signal peptidase II [Candidatus Binatia bacterium]|nr:signal peptidase II [Candidatus Binatia bacterium]